MSSILDKEQEEYLKICQLRNREYLKKWTEKLKELESKLDDISREMMLTIRNKKDAEYQVATFSNALEINKDKYLAEFKAMKDLDCYEYIELTKINGELAFKGRTKLVEIEHEKKTYKLGSYDVIIQNGKVVFQQEKNNETVIHPHISNGNPCLGDAAQSIPKFLAAYEYAIVFDMMYKFLCSYNPGNPYRKLSEFKERSK